MASTGSQSLKGTGYNLVNFPNKTNQQMDLFNTLMSGGMGGLSGGLQHLSQLAQGGNQDYWDQLEAPALRQFQQLQGDVASRFSGMGTGARHSSGFQNTLGGAAADLSERLQSNRLGMQNQAIRELLGLYGDLMGQDLMSSALVPKKKSWWQELLGGVAPGAAQGLGSFGTMGLSKWAGLY